jgi:hypothetical protein
LRCLLSAACLLWAGAASPAGAVPLDLLQLQSVEIPAGGSLAVRGAMRSSYDGSVIDAATTRHGDGRIEAGGLIDFEAGGLRLVGQDAEKHDYRFAPTGRPGHACVAARLVSPCLISRLLPLAQARLLTLADFSASLSGELSTDSPPSPSSGWPRWPLVLIVGAGTAALVVLRRRRQVEAAPCRQALRLVRRLRRRLRKGDPVHQRLLAPLAALAAGAERLEGERRRGLSEGWPGEAARAEASLKDIVASLENMHRTLDVSTRLERAHLDPRLLAELDQGMAAATAAIQELS